MPPFYGDFMKKNGFTLLEILLVISLILVVTLMFVPKVSMLNDNSRKIVDQQSAANIVNQINHNEVSNVREIINGDSRELTEVELGFEFPIPQHHEATRFYVYYRAGNLSSIEVRYDDINGELLYESVFEEWSL